MTKPQFRQLWSSLRDQHVSATPFLRRIRLTQLRGIRDLHVVFKYPVSVLAGENGCGKSTVLFAAACAYKNFGNGTPAFTPNGLFQRYEPKSGAIRDQPEQSEFSAGIEVEDGEVRVDWELTGDSRWVRTDQALGETTAPRHRCFLRTMTTHVDSQRAVRALGGTRQRSPLQHTALNPEQVDFAHQVIPHIAHRDVVHLTKAKNNILFTTREDDAKYSELQMAGGERAVLRLAMEIAELHDALVLIDEVEAGLHPLAQELLMLTLQQLALHNNLQIIVSTHSPVVLDCVPPSGRVFLERTGEKCTTIDAYPDLIERALYGRLLQGFRLLCEDDVAEALITGILNHMIPREGWPLGAIQVVRDTGASEFPTHAKAFAKCGVLDSFAFVLDGDQQGTIVEKRLRRVTSQPIIFLPGQAPEQWVWDNLNSSPEKYAAPLGADLKELKSTIRNVRALYIKTNGTPTKKAKHMLAQLANGLSCSVPDVCRIVAREEISRPISEIHRVGKELRSAFEEWRRNYMRRTD